MCRGGHGAGHLKGGDGIGCSAPEQRQIGTTAKPRSAGIGRAAHETDGRWFPTPAHEDPADTWNGRTTTGRRCSIMYGRGWYQHIECCGPCLPGLTSR